MTTVDGFIMSTAAGRFTATFVVNGLLTTFNGNFSSALPMFSVYEATLTFASPNHLTSTRSFHGVVGTRTISLTFANGPTMAGDLHMPIGQANSVNGSGVWIQN